MTEYPFRRPIESPPDHPTPRRIGRSRDGRPISAYRIGDGPLRVSLVGGCHADEPVGPRFLGRLVRFLTSPGGWALHDAATWFIIPHINPDGAVANAAWQPPDAGRYDFVAHLKHRVRELPGDDIEFGFPRDEDDTGARPENRAAWDFWRAHAPFDLHVSMHGMGMARFRPSSMEAVRALGGDPLTLVTEMPLFITPGVGDELGPPDPVLVRWRERVAQWEGRLRGAVGSGGGPGGGDGMAARLDAKARGGAGDDGAAERAKTEVREEVVRAGLRAMPVEDQMRFQWALIRAGLGVARARRD